MARPTITILDAIHCRADKKARPLIKDCLAYKATHWKRDEHGAREANVVGQFLITGREGTSGMFLTGLLPRVKKHCKKKGIKIKVVGKLERLRPTGTAHLDGITFREDQSSALLSARAKQRGKIIFPTGSGKTVIALGIMSMFSGCRMLWLCHTKDLLQQTREALIKHNFQGVHMLGGGHKTDFNKWSRESQVILLSTIQSYHNLDYKKLSSFFDLTIVDEMHHVNSESSRYGEVMRFNLSPRRYGLTATEPTTEAEYLVNEGIFGPVVATLEMQEGIDAGIVAKPILNLISIPYEPEINQKCKRYKDYYEFGVVHNKQRNKLIAREAVVAVGFNHTTLIIIERTDHGYILKDLFRKKGVVVPFVHGDTSSGRRNNVKKKLSSGRLPIVICSKIWREGINIPSLNHVVNACGMKDEKMVIQALGRGLRTTKEKTTIQLTDFLDPYKFLAEHSILRLQTYKKMRWM